MLRAASWRGFAAQAVDPCEQVNGLCGKVVAAADLLPYAQRLLRVVNTAIEVTQHEMHAAGPIKNPAQLLAVRAAFTELPHTFEVA